MPNSLPTSLGAPNRSADGVSPRIVLSSLWTTMLLVFAYVDIFGFWRAEVVRGALAGTVPGVGFTIDQRFLTLTTLYVLIPALMVAGSVLLPRSIARPASIALAGLYAVSIVVSCIGETWIYYLLGSAIEVALLVLIGVHAWRWGTGAAATTESQP